MKVWKVDKTTEIPHGIRYSLTLHDPSNERILGFDNAHGVKPKKKKPKYTGRIKEFDHKHVDENDTGTTYEFESPEQLMIDFFDAADETLVEHKGNKK
jgi:hypothetical protein